MENQIIIDSLVQTIETQNIEIKKLRTKLSSSCKRPNGHERHPSCDCLSEEAHESGACRSDDDCLSLHC